MTNLLHLAELLHTATIAEHLGPSGLLRWFQQQRRSRSTMVEAVKLRLERDDRAVQLITIHRSKGLEYPVVYCPYLWDGAGLFASEEDNLLFHDPEDGDRLKIDVRRKPRSRKEKDADPHIALARREKAAENLRLLYVALTRARHRCVVVWGRSSAATARRWPTCWAPPPAPRCPVGSRVHRRRRQGDGRRRHAGPGCTSGARARGRSRRSSPARAFPTGPPRRPR